MKAFPFSIGTRENTAMTDSRSAADVQISLLGGFAVTVSGESVEDHWRLRKAKTLVKLLALAPGHRLHRDTVMDRLWPDIERGAAANNLHQIVYTIRHMMGPESITLMTMWYGFVRPAGSVSMSICSSRQPLAPEGPVISEHCSMHCNCGPARCYRRIGTPTG